MKVTLLVAAVPVAMSHISLLLSLSRAIGSVPVINALSDLHHPLQTLADLMTLQEQFGELNSLTVTWIGDGDNVLHDLMLGCALLGVNVHLCCPPGYEPYQGVMNMAQKLASASGSRITVICLPLFIYAHYYYYLIISSSPSINPEILICEC